MISQDKINKIIVLAQITTLILVVAAFFIFFNIQKLPDYRQPPEPKPDISRVAPDAQLNQDHVLAFILKHEGTALRTEPNGSYSKYGITQLSWTQWRKRQGDMIHLPKSVTDIRNEAEIKRFYYDYLDRFHVWELHPALQLIYADMAVLSGSEAVRIIQEIVGAKVDGVWGSHTEAGVKHFNESIKNDTLKAFNNFDTYKREYLKDLARHPKYAKELKGWLERADDLRDYMLKQMGDA